MGADSRRSHFPRALQEIVNTLGCAFVRAEGPLLDMKTLRWLLLLLLPAVGTASFAQAPVPISRAPAPVLRRTPREIEQLIAPIALYPDALIALILPACTAPTDVVLAARYAREFPNDYSQVEHRAWDESVKSLLHYPEVLLWLDENLPWTKQVGETFAEQPADVMQAVQRLRASARATGALVDTPQQQIISDADVLRIIPAQPDIIYVPYYDPEVVFVERPVYFPHSSISFGVGVGVGSWLAYEFDWRRHALFAGNRHRPWSGHDWHRPLVAVNTVTVTGSRPVDVRQWRPPPRPVAAAMWQSHAAIVRPAPVRPPSEMPHAQGPLPPENRNRQVLYGPGVTPTARPIPPGTRRGAPSPAASLPPPTTVVANTSPEVQVPNAVVYLKTPATTAIPPTPVASPNVRPERNRDREPRNRPSPAAANPPPASATMPVIQFTPPAPPPQAAAPGTPAPPRSSQHYRSPSGPTAAAPPPATTSPTRTPPPVSTTATPPAPPPPRSAPAPERRDVRRIETEKER